MRSVPLVALALASLAAAPRAVPTPSTPARIVHGMTVSCETWGIEWGSDRFASTLDELAELGVNWVAIHPYASLREDGTVEARRIDPEHPPEWLTRPIREAHARGLSILVIPHIANWGTRWRWRGDIELVDPEARQRFFETYGSFLAGLVRCAGDADAFSIGNELEKLVVHEAEWRGIIARLRQLTPKKLTYAANWTGYADVPFWDALDAVGVDAYFPLSESDEPTEASLRAAWQPVLANLEQLAQRTGKPVVFTEIGYNCSLDAARTPWTPRESRGEERPRAEALQTLCLRIALDEVGKRSEWLRGVFVWKWFVGSGRRENFLAKTPAMQSVLRAAWREPPR